MRRASILLIVCLLSGCHTHSALRERSINVPATWTDIHYRQVLTNVAFFACNPDAIPAFSVANGGTVSITDGGTASLSPTYSPTLSNTQQGGGALPILSILFNAGASRQITENWTLIPTTDPDNLRRLQSAFQFLFTDLESRSMTEQRKELADFFLIEENELGEKIPQGWFHIGRKCDVPKNACYVGHYRDTYAWVCRDGLAGLSDFTLTSLDLATGELQRPQRTIVKTYKGAEKPENLETTQITTTDVDREAVEAARKSKYKPDRERVTDDPNKGSRGLFFVPK